MPDRIRMRDMLDPAAWEALDRWRDAARYNTVSIYVLQRQVDLHLSGLYGSSIQRLVTDREPYPNEPQDWADVVRRALAEVDAQQQAAADARARLEREAAAERAELEAASSVELPATSHDRDSREDAP